jgi:peptidoglycan DL-endopeptidase CwlO
VLRLPDRKRVPPRAARPPRRSRPCRAWGRAVALVGAVSLASLTLPAGVGSAAPGGSPSLKQLLARANKLSNEIDSLGQQYDGLKIQLAEARSETKIARKTRLRDQKLLASGQAAVGQIAAVGYMGDGLSPTLELLQDNDPQTLLNRASIMGQLARQNGAKLDAARAAAAAAQRAQLTAQQESQRAAKLATELRTKVAAIQAKVNVLNSATYARAMDVYRQTGHYPAIQLRGDSLGVQALRYALTMLGKPYVWGGASPSVGFDCSGLVMWSYEQVGISLEHYTGDQWNEGVHIPRSQLKPGDLVFFFADISHVGMYIGKGMMIDAPTFGQVVQIQPIYWGAFVGAVEIV